MTPALYAAYFTGASGSNLALLYLGNGVFAGIDGGTNKYDGNYMIENDGSLRCKVKYTIPSGIPLVTGGILDKESHVDIEFVLPELFWNDKIIEIKTPTGAINIRFEKLRDLQ